METAARISSASANPSTSTAAICFAAITADA
jgi:hypothetical protein